MNEPPTSMPYGVLRQRRPDYDEKRYQTVEDLYLGGFDVMKRAETYLVRSPGESGARFEYRKQMATYRPYFGQIVDQFTSDLFDADLTITPASDASDKSTPGTDTTDDFYTRFAKNADGQGHSFVDVCKDVLTTALKHQAGILFVDAPKDSGANPTSLAEEDAAGLRDLYAYEIPPAALLDYECSEDGALAWAIVYACEKKRTTPQGSRASTRETFTLWTIGPDGKAMWVRFAVTWTETTKPKDDALIPVEDWGATNFTRIPLHFLRLPAGLWVGNKIGPQALEHFRRSSALVGAESDSLCAIPFVALGGEMGAPGGEMPAERAQDPSRGDDPVKQFRQMGALVLGKGETLDFAEPTGRAYELVDKQLKELRDDMFAVNHQMAASVRTNSTALGRSGLSKQSDKESTAKVLVALGRIVRSLALEVYDCIATARGEEIEWAAHGLDDFDPVDRESLLDESIALDQVAIPSPTFRKLHKFNVARQLAPNATPQELDTIRQEIGDGVDAAEDAADAMKEAQLAAAADPQGQQPDREGERRGNAPPGASGQAKPPVGGGRGS